MLFIDSAVKPFEREGKMMTLRQIIGFILILFSSVPVLAQIDVGLYAEPVGEHYRIRWGEREPPEDDLVKPYPPPIWANGYAACFKKGSQITLRLIRRQGAPEVKGWKVLYAELRSKVTGDVYWVHKESRMLGPNEGYFLGSLPDFIEWAELRGSVIVEVGPPQPPEPEPGGSESSLLVQPIDRVTEIFVVLDKPKSPMDPAWVNVLRISCSWARGESTNDGAAEKLTIELHKNWNYNDGNLAYTRYLSDPDTGETFYLKEFLRDPNRLGQCNDFADFLVCLMTSVGIPRAAQRTHPIYPVRRITTLPNGHLGRLEVFTTHPLDIAKTGSSDYDGPQDWPYHQFCLDYANSKVWDGMIAFLPQGWRTGDPIENQTFVLGMPRDSEYRDRLMLLYHFFDFVDKRMIVINDPAFFWRPTPFPSGFIPVVTAAELP
ncbi:MAG: hypothetical protein QXQ50_10100 [Candidatus Bathyarchaeia archaeon]